MFKKITAVSLAVCSTFAFAADDSELQDMSDPLAVYTQGGVGYTDKGLNIKIGQSYDTGSDTTMGMNVIEMKGIFGDAIGTRDSDEALYGNVDDSIDSFRFRNFTVDMTNGRGSQIDVNYSVDTERADASYSILQALPKMGPINLYPLAGVGATIENDAQDGYNFEGTYALVGMYGKWAINDKIWLNYNPIWLSTLSGSEDYKNHGWGNEDALFTHEFAASYQITPRSNIRYFANWNEKVDFGDGDHRIEYNYQF